MKVLLLKDVYKLGHAGDVKKVADGYARNFLIPQRLATPATAAAIQHAESLRQNAAIERAKLNAELSGVAEKIGATTLTFPVKAGETGKLYGSVTAGQIVEALERATGLKVDRRNVGHQPLRELGEFRVPVRLTTDLIPAVRVVIHREGEALKQAAPAAVAPEAAAPQAAAPQAMAPQDAVEVPETAGPEAAATEEAA